MRCATSRPATATAQARTAPVPPATRGCALTHTHTGRWVGRWVGRRPRRSRGWSEAGRRGSPGGAPLSAELPSRADRVRWAGHSCRLQQQQRPRPGSSQPPVSSLQSPAPSPQCVPSPRFAPPGRRRGRESQARRSQAAASLSVQFAQCHSPLAARASSLFPSGPQRRQAPPAPVRACARPAMARGALQLASRTQADGRGHTAPPPHAFSVHCCRASAPAPRRPGGRDRRAPPLQAPSSKPQGQPPGRGRGRRVGGGPARGALDWLAAAAAIGPRPPGSRSSRRGAANYTSLARRRPGVAGRSSPRPCRRPERYARRREGAKGRRRKAGIGVREGARAREGRALHPARGSPAARWGTGTGAGPVGEGEGEDAGEGEGEGEGGGRAPRDGGGERGRCLRPRRDLYRSEGPPRCPPGRDPAASAADAGAVRRVRAAPASFPRPSNL